MITPPPGPPQIPDYSSQYVSAFSVKTYGECCQGSQIQVWVPDQPYNEPNGTKKAVIYLHGFALGPSKIYQTHIEHLAKQGYYVFYPIYQRSFCSAECLPISHLLKIAIAILDPCRVDAEQWVRNAIYSVNGAINRLLSVKSAQLYGFWLFQFR